MKTQTQKYSVNQHLIQTILTWVNTNEIAIPEIQRPFVWDSSKIRDLMDSLYQGYPIGYLIAWKNPNVRLKNGHTAEGKKILIDGQQRVTALTAAILGKEVISKDYQKIKIKIAFHPKSERFEVRNPAIERDKEWIPDISVLFRPDFNLFELVNHYCSLNSDMSQQEVFNKLNNLQNISSKQIGMIELDSDLDIDVVTEIFIRINSQGVVLSQADFAMSKIASNEVYDGVNIRKCIDYFCHLAVDPKAYRTISELDKEFASTKYFASIKWLKDEVDDLYDPSYTDVIRVAFTSEFNRGRLSDLVSLLSGRNFETKTFEEEIAEESFKKLSKGIDNFVKEYNFKQFIMIIRSAGYISTFQIRSQNALNFAYILFLKLKALGIPAPKIESYVKRWFVLTLLTKRYSGSAESVFDFDIKNISSRPFDEYLKDIEDADLSEGFWNHSLIQSLQTSVASSPFFGIFIASQVKSNDKGFLSRDISINDLITHMGDIHHIFPKDYLKKNGMSKGDYNQIANYVYMQTETNISIGNKAPKDYFKVIIDQCNGGKLKYGAIDKIEILKENLKQNCVPESIFEMDASKYSDFLEERRNLIAAKIKEYYLGL